MHEFIPKRIYIYIWMANRPVVLLLRLNITECSLKIGHYIRGSCILMRLSYGLHLVIWPSPCSTLCVCVMFHVHITLCSGLRDLLTISFSSVCHTSVGIIRLIVTIHGLSSLKWGQPISYKVVGKIGSS